MPISAIALRRLDEEMAGNQRRYQLVATVVVVALGIIGALIALAFGSWPAGLGIGVAVGVLLVAFAPGVGERLALRTVGAKPADPKRFPRYQNLVEGLCEELGMPVPKLWVVDSEAANAMALGRNPSEATLVVTTGLLGLLNRVELEGVLAAELAHIRASSARLGSMTVVLGGAGGLLLEARRRGGNPLLGALGWALLALAPLRRLAVPAQRHVQADEGAAYLTRYPPGLVGALRKLGGQTGGGTVSNLGLNHLWIVDPRPEPPPAAPDRFFASHPPLDERVENLCEL
ncbi:MAG TPA: M48 family metalloprotease [Actinomycetota bacterium]|nr:M48 family metalloprotease [Actinomycetota bacterium]